MAQEIKLAVPKTRVKGEKKLLGRYYLTFQFGDNEDGEKMAQRFKTIVQEIGGVATVFEMVMNKKLGK